MRFFTKKLVITSLFLILFIDGLGVSIILPLFVDMFLNQDSSILPYVSSGAFRNFFYGLSLVSFSLGMFFGAPILGQLSDRLGRKKILLYALWGTTIGYILSGIGIYIRSPQLFILGRVLDGLTAGSIPVAQAVISDISAEDKKVANLGLVLFAVTLGYILGPLVSRWLCYQSTILNLHLPFFAVALLSFISIIFLLPLRETSRFRAKQAHTLFYSLNMLALLRKVENVKMELIAFLFFQLGWTMYFQYVPYFLASSGQNGLTVMLLTSIGIGMSLSFCLLTRVFQSIWTPIIGSILTISIIVLSISAQILFQANAFVLILAAFIGALGYGMGYSYLLAYLSQNVKQTLQGLVMGMAASMSALASVSTALLGAAVVNFSFQLTYISSMVFLMLCLLILCTGAHRP